MLNSWVKETVSAGGTGNLTLSGADGSDRITVNAAFGTDFPFRYFIEDGDDRESGWGHLSASTTLVRDVVIETLVSGTYDRTSPSAINVSTSAKVYCGIGTGAVPSCFSAVSAESEAWIIQQNASAGGAVNFATVADRLCYIPAFFSYCGEITGAVIDVQSTAASSIARAGIYTIGTDGEPENLIAQTGDIDVSSAATKQAAWSGGGTIFLFPGWYYLALASEGGHNVAGKNTVYSWGGGPHGVTNNLIESESYLYETLSGGWSSLPSTAAASLTYQGGHWPTVALY